MIFRRAKEPLKKLNTVQGHTKLSIKRDGDVEKQIQMIGLTKEDLDIAKSLQPFVLASLDQIVERFYKNLENEPSLLTIIKDNSSIERLKKTLSQHITEMFEGVIDSAFFEKRTRIANVHVRIGLQTKWYMCAFQDLFISLSDIVEENLLHKKEYFAALRAISKILNLEQQLVLEAYDRETARIKQELEDEKSNIKDNITSASQSLAAISEQTNASFLELIAQSEEITASADVASELSVLAEERSLKGKEQINNQDVSMSNIEHTLNEIANDVKVLLDISKQMQGIINIVTGVADQTNLLSLNAAIEAARAGEHGRGFSIVAGEVRKLSEETKQSVTNVSNLILNTNSQVSKLGKSLDRIRIEVEQGSNSMKETNIYFEEIMSAMNDTKEQNRAIKNELVSFVSVVNDLGKAFEEVAISADKLTNITHELN